MARLPRLDLPGIPQHIVQRGNNRLTDDPAGYRWSSCATHLGQRAASGLEAHPAWLALGNTAGERTLAYRRLLGQALPDDTLAEIRAYLQQQRALGHDAFKAMVEARTQRFAGIRPAHRPRLQPLRDKST